MDSVKQSLTKRQGTRIFIVSIAIFFILSSFELATIIKQKRHSLTSLQNQIIELASDGAAQALWSLDKTQGSIHLDAILKIHSVQQVDIHELDGTIFVSREKLKQVTTPLEHRIGQWLFGALLVAVEPLFIVIEQIGEASRKDSIGTICITMDPVPLANEFIFDVRNQVAGEALRVLLLAIILSIVLHRFLTKPLASLGTHIGETDSLSADTALLEVPPGHAGDEIGMIVRQFNRKQRKISEAIAKIKQSEDSLQESELRFQALFEGAQDGILVADLESKNFIAANRAICSMTGYTSDALLTMNIPDIHPQADLPDVQEQFERQARGEFVVAQDLPVLRRDGTVFSADISVSHMESNGRLCIAGFFRDITERKKNDKRLQHVQKIEAIATLAGGIAHDFNNILGAILGFADMAREDVEDGSSVSDDLDMIILSGNRAKELVAQIQTFSHQTKSEKIDLQPELIVREVVKLLRSSIPSTITINLDIENEYGSIKADPTQLYQVVMNLCTNAYQVMENDGGVLSIGLAKTELKADDLRNDPALKAGPYVQLTVSDTGSGIDPMVQDHIFDPYFTTKKVGKGTGMGLSIVHGIIKKHGGMIRFESRIGEGSTFHAFFQQH